MHAYPDSVGVVVLWRSSVRQLGRAAGGWASHIHWGGENRKWAVGIAAKGGWENPIQQIC